ncbi:DUF3592 domain-containing protein [Chloroflexota bacterium]
MESSDIGGIIILLMGIAAFAWAALFIIKARSTKRWPTAEGEIISSDIDIVHIKWTGQDMIVANIEYKYTVEGNEYKYFKVRPTERIAGGKACEQAVERYPVGSQVTVYYNQNRPEEAVLEPVVQKGGPIALSILGCFGLIMGLAVILT